MSTTFAILAYDGIEPIDIGATFGVLSMAKRLSPALRFFVVSPQGGAVEMANGLTILAHHGFADCPAADVVIVLGGPGWEQASGDAAMLGFLRQRAEAGQVMASVCTGGMILGAAGLLDGHRATTKREILGGEAQPLALLAERHSGVEVIEARLVDEGAIVTGGGVSLGIDLTLHLLARFCGPVVADETARVLEYSRARDVNRAALRDVIQTVSG